MANCFHEFVGLFSRTSGPPKKFMPKLHAQNCRHSFQGEIIYTPTPPPPFLAKRHFSGEGGGGVYFEAPRARNFIPPPPFYAPPTPRRVFSGMGGWGCIKFGPVFLSNFTFSKPICFHADFLLTGAVKVCYAKAVPEVLSRGASPGFFAWGWKVLGKP